MHDPPTFEDVRDAAARIAGHVHRTPVLRSRSLDARAGRELFLKSEHLQRVGAFKFRGATNAVRALPADVVTRGVAAHSSGNHAAALALAARDRGVPAWVVMPDNAPAAKRAAVEGYGATVLTCAPTLADREATLARLLEETGATEVHPYDDPWVIAGAGTAALELLEDAGPLDAIVAPVGGGGLLSGTSVTVSARGEGTIVVGGEPEGADDAARSLDTGVLVPAGATDTIADGLLTSLSERTFGIIRDHVTDIVTVSEPEIVEAMRLAWERTKQIIEPSAAVAVAVALRPDVPLGDRVGVMLTGGNLDLDRLPFGRDRDAD